MHVIVLCVGEVIPDWFCQSHVLGPNDPNERAILEKQTVYRRDLEGLKFKEHFVWRYCDFSYNMPKNLQVNALMQLMALCVGTETLLAIWQAV